MLLKRSDWLNAYNCVQLADSANCCTGSHDTAATCPPSGVTDYDFFSMFRLNKFHHKLTYFSTCSTEDACPDSYVYAYDESSGTALWTCPDSASPDYTLTFCPWRGIAIDNQPKNLNFVSHTLAPLFSLSCIQFFMYMYHLYVKTLWAFPRIENYSPSTSWWGATAVQTAKECSHNHFLFNKAPWISSAYGRSAGFFVQQRVVRSQIVSGHQTSCGRAGRSPSIKL